MPKYIFDITPIAAPRLTQRDKWKNTMTDRAKAYYQYKNDLGILALQNKFKPIYDSLYFKFFLPFYGKPTIENNAGLENLMPHKNKPDIDNLVKGWIDSLYLQDAQIWHIEAWKYWTFKKSGWIEIETDI